MHTRHHIFNFHIGFWGALLISGVVTIQSALLLLMTSSFSLAQTTSFITMSQPAVDIQLLKGDSLQLQASISEPSLNPFQFTITEVATGEKDVITGNSSDFINFTGIWTSTVDAGDYILVATVEDSSSVVQNSDPITIEIIDSVQVDVPVPVDTSFPNNQTSANLSATTSIPVDELKFTFETVPSSTPIILSANSIAGDQTNWQLNFNPSILLLGDYVVTAEAFLAGSSAGQTQQATQIRIVDASVQDTIDISEPATGSILSGSVIFKAIASANATNVQFLMTSVGGQQIWSGQGQPIAGSTNQFSASLDTTTLPNTGTQPYALSVSGTIGGTIVPSPSISIFINNAVTTNPPVITTTTLPNGTVGLPYASPVIVTQGTPPYTYAISSGNLPTNLSINSTGIISGTPTTASDFSFTVLVTDAAGATTSQTFGVTIAQPATGAPLAILSSNVDDAKIALPLTWTIQGTGGVPPYTWNVIAGALPSQMQLLEIAGEAVIQGTPDTPGPITFTLELKDSAGEVLQQTFEAKLFAPETTESDDQDATTENETETTSISIKITEPVPTQTVSGNSVPVKIQSSSAISAPKMSLVSSTGQNLLLTNNTAGAPFGDNSGKTWFFTLDTTKYPNGTYTLRADSSTNSGTSATPISITIKNGEALQVFSGSISSPRSGQTVAGKVPLIAKVSGEVKSLMFIIETSTGKQKAPIPGIPNAAGNYEAIWDSAGDPGGAYAIRAEVFDAQNQKKGITAVKVTLRETKPAVAESTPDQVVDPKVVTNLQQGIVSEVPVECQVEEINDAAECKKFLEQRRIKLLNEREQEVLEQEQLPEVLTRHISLDQGKATQKQEGKVIQDPLSGIIPIDKQKTADRSVLVLGSTEPPAALKPFVQQTVPAVITFDQDGDGLPDDMEKRYGTDPLKADTDGDGFDDATEIKNGFNPNGPGKLVEELAPVERAILNKLPLDQPRFAGALDEGLEVAAVVSDKETTEAGFTITGKAEPNAIVTLYIYSSLPIVVTTKTDAAGNWSYEMEDALVDGQHDVYVAVTNETGKIEKKSRALSFFVDSAYAVSEEEFLASGSTITSSTSKFLLWYIIGGVLAVGLGGALFFFYFNNRVVIPE